MKNKRNRERYAPEIEQLREKTDELERIYQWEKRVLEAWVVNCVN